MDDVLGEQDALELDEEEVHQLLEILQNSLNSFLGDSVVFPGAERGDKPLGEDQPSSNLKCSGDCKGVISMRKVPRDNG